MLTTFSLFFYFYDSTRATCNNTPHTGRQADLVRSSVAILVCACVPPLQKGKDNHTSAENRRASLSKRASLPACTGWVREGEERQGLLCVTRLRINITRFLYIPHASLVSCLSVVEDASHPLPHTRDSFIFFSFSTFLPTDFIFIIMKVLVHFAAGHPFLFFLLGLSVLHCQCTPCAIVYSIPFISVH